MLIRLQHKQQYCLCYVLNLCKPLQYYLRSRIVTKKNRQLNMRDVKKLRCLFLKFMNNFKHNGYYVKHPALSKELNVYLHGVILK